MKKKSYIRPIIIGFAALYIFSMLISTYIVKEKYSNQYARNQNDILRNVTSYFKHTSRSKNEIMGYLITGYQWRTEMDSKYQQFSVALYDSDSKKIEELHSVIYLPTIDGKTDELIPEEFFIKEEVSRLYAFYGSKEDWVVETRYEKESGRMISLEISEKTDSKKKNVWIWEEPDAQAVDAENLLVRAKTHRSLGNLIRVPYLSDGFERYEQWINDDFLQGFPTYCQQYSGDIYSVRELSGLKVHDEISTHLMSSDIDSGSCTLVLRSTTKPLLAAMDYLKNVYLITFLMMLLCMLVVIFHLNKTYRERQIVAETRRDFSNAIAHELKTPLGIIRNFAENLLENTNTEKESYYLRQIDKQTETMKELAKEMLYVSDLDSAQISFAKNPVSLSKVIEEQYEKLMPLADEKNLEIRYEETAEFMVNGDKSYLEKAIWNLLSNAIVYNHLDGFIIVQITPDSCSIENTGKQIKEEDLPHVFDMFYTGDKSRNSSEKHLGLGLYLAKRILTLHHLGVTINNTDTGVKVTIRK